MTFSRMILGRMTKVHSAEWHSGESNSERITLSRMKLNVKTLSKMILRLLTLIKMTLSKKTLNITTLFKKKNDIIIFILNVIMLKAVMLRVVTSG